MAETIIGLYKAEVIHRQGPLAEPRRGRVRHLEWVDWFNHRRLLEPIGYTPPAELERAYYRQLEGSAAIAV